MQSPDLSLSDVQVEACRVFERTDIAVQRYQQSRSYQYEQRFEAPADLGQEPEHQKESTRESTISFRVVGPLIELGIILNESMYSWLPLAPYDHQTYASFK